jgi:hypothetical protein
MVLGGFSSFGDVCYPQLRNTVKKMPLRFGSRPKNTDSVVNPIRGGSAYSNSCMAMRSVQCRVPGVLGVIFSYPRLAPPPGARIHAYRARMETQPSRAANQKRHAQRRGSRRISRQWSWSGCQVLVQFFYAFAQPVSAVFVTRCR